MQRTVTTATQSLLLLNSDWAGQRARRLGCIRMVKAQVRAAHQLTFGREPSVEHLASGIAYLNLGGKVAANPEPPKLECSADARKPSGMDSAMAANMLCEPPRGPRCQSAFHGRAFIRLDSLYADASVRTIVSQ